LPIGNAYSHSYRYTYRHSNTYRDSYRYTYRHSNTYRDSYSYPCTYSYTDTYTYADINSDSTTTYAYSNSNCNSDTDARSDYTWRTRLQSARFAHGGSLMDRGEFEQHRRLPQRRFYRYGSQRWFLH
jgi:hypothetical protein